MTNRQQVINRLETALSDLHSFATKDDPICLTQEEVLEIIDLLKDQGLVRCKDCRWHDICWLRESNWYCATGCVGKGGNGD